MGTAASTRFCYHLRVNSLQFIFVAILQSVFDVIHFDEMNETEFLILLQVVLNYYIKMKLVTISRFILLLQYGPPKLIDCKILHDGA